MERKRKIFGFNNRDIVAVVVCFVDIRAALAVDAGFVAGSDNPVEPETQWQN